MIRYNTTLFLRSPSTTTSLLCEHLFLTAFLLLSFLIALMVIPSRVQAAQVALAWDANTPVPDGYHLYRRLENQNYDYNQPVWEGTTTSCSLDDLQDGAIYYFTIRAYVGEQESGDSNEVRLETSATIPDQPPTADAGGDQTVQYGTTVQLSGAASNDPDGNIVSYAWTQTQGPGVTLSDSGAIAPSFTAPSNISAQTVLGFQLSVTDDQGLSASDSCIITVTPPPAPANQPPTSDAGGNQTADSESQVILDGGNSSDPENQALTYSWTQSAGTTVTLSNSHVVQPQFTAPLVSQTTTLAFELRVTDPQGLSSADTCLVMITPPSPDNGDRDGDGYPDTVDAFPDDSTEWLDTDGDGTGNNADTDDDNDQMTDIWENQYGLNPLVNDASQDLDGDGISNLDEFNQGTDPTMPNGNLAPLAPAIIYPADGDNQVSMNARFIASPFDDPDAGDSHGATQWRIFKTDNGALVLDRTVSRRNLEVLRIPRLVLRSSTTYTCKVRYFDNLGTASPWSETATFTTIESKWDKNKNGVPDNQEVSVSTDLNQDGIADIEQDTMVKSVQIDEETQLGISILNSRSAISIESAELIMTDTFEDCPYTAQETPYGLMGFAVKVDQPGQEADLELYSSKQIPGAAAQWIRYDEVDGWKVCDDGSLTSMDDGAVHYRIKDGEADDADGVANGIIINLSGPRLLESESEDTSLENDGNASTSGSSDRSVACFISSLLQ